MAKYSDRLLVPVAAIAPICGKCNKNKAYAPNGAKHYWSDKNTVLCHNCKRPDKKQSGVKTEKVYKNAEIAGCKYTCTMCGYVAPKHIEGVITIDHIDGLHFNNQVHNLQRLCRNCHWIKGIENNDNDSDYLKLIRLRNQSMELFNSACDYILANVPSDKKVRGDYTKTYKEYMVTVDAINRIKAEMS